MVLGQDQDSFGGGFEPHQSFVGEMRDVTLWDHVLGPKIVSRMSNTCNVEGGSRALKWSDFVSGIQGKVEIKQLNPC